MFFYYYMYIPMTKTTRPFAQWRPLCGMPLFFLLKHTGPHDKNDTSVLLATHVSKMPFFFIRRMHAHTFPWIKRHDFNRVVFSLLAPALPSLGPIDAKLPV
jgi:hypothetical protein